MLEALRAACAAVVACEPPLLDLLNEAEAAIQKEPARQAGTALGQLPAASVLQGLQLKLPSMVRHAEESFQALQAALDALESSSPQSPLSGELSAESLAATAAAEEDVRKSAAAAVKQFEPLLQRARTEVELLHRAAEWREYTDLFSKSVALQQRLAKIGSAGIQAWFMEHGGRMTGPYQFDQTAQVAGNFLAVRKLLDEVEVIDAGSLHVLGRGDATAMTIRLPGTAESAQPDAVKIRLTDGCEEVRVQLEFIQHRTTELLTHLHTPVAGSGSRYGRILEVLADPKAQGALHDEHRKASHRWERLADELAALGVLKERLTTYFLLQRMSLNLPMVLEHLQAARQELSEVTQRLAAVIARCGRDVESNRLIVPPTLAAAYAQAQDARHHSIKNVARLEARLKRAAAQLSERLGDPVLCGHQQVPTFRVLPALPPAIVELSDAISDESLLTMAASLGAALGTALPQPTPAARPDLGARRRERRTAANEHKYDDAGSSDTLAVRADDTGT